MPDVFTTGRLFINSYLSGWHVQRFNQGTALKRTIFELIAQELIDKYAAASTPDSSAHGNPATTTARCLLPASVLAVACCKVTHLVALNRQSGVSSAASHHRSPCCRDDQEMGDARPSPAKRQLSWEPGSEVGEGLAFQGPGGGAIEGPPLLGRASAGSAHGGLEYYRCRLGECAAAVLRPLVLLAKPAACGYGCEA